jgi:hypothetical protein
VAGLNLTFVLSELLGIAGSSPGKLPTTAAGGCGASDSCLMKGMWAALCCIMQQHCNLARKGKQGKSRSTRPAACTQSCGGTSNLTKPTVLCLLAL